jgi:hypothetical protein
VEGIVPRVLWPGKPINFTGYEFSLEYWDLPSTTTTSTADTFVGGLYLYGGWVPMLAGMFLLGCGIRLLDDQLDVQGNRHAIFLVLLLIPQLVTTESDWVGVLSSIPATAFVWLLAIFVTFGRRSGNDLTDAAKHSPLAAGANGAKLA